MSSDKQLDVSLHATLKTLRSTSSVLSPLMRYKTLYFSEHCFESPLDVLGCNVRGRFAACCTDMTPLHTMKGAHVERGCLLR